VLGGLARLAIVNEIPDLLAMRHREGAGNVNLSGGIGVLDAMACWAERLSGTGFRPAIGPTPPSFIVNCEALGAFRRPFILAARLIGIVDALLDQLVAPARRLAYVSLGALVLLHGRSSVQSTAPGTLETN
jgi:hypothetical protein